MIMNKKLLLVLLAVCGTFFGKAQMLPVGSFAPDFTVTDINNVTHNLYTYTDAGYTVFIDVSATWCPPCWAVHSSHVFDSLMVKYGPNGTVDPGKVMVLYIEGDLSTGAADLAGTTANSQGDWVTGTTYPIVDVTDNSFVTAYPIGGYPTFYSVCPNRTISMTQAGYTQAMLGEAFWTGLVGNCPVKSNGDNAGMVNALTDQAICEGGSTSLSAQIQNMGTNPITAATVEALDGSTVIATTNWTGNLNTYDYTTVNIGNYTFPGGITNITYRVTANGDVNAMDNEIAKNVEALVSNYQLVTLQVKTDQYPGEIAWRVLNSSNQVVEQKKYTAGTGQNGSGGPDAGMVFNHELQLNPAECYSIEVTDDYGDGLTGVQNAVDSGYIRLYDGLPTSQLMIDYGSNYANGFNSIFKTGTAVSVNNILSQDEVKIYPNPTSDFINISLNLNTASDVSLQLIDMNGKVVMTKNIANLQVSNQQLNVQTLPSGFYNLQVRSEQGVRNMKVVLTK